MASEQDDAVFPEEDLDDDDDESQEDEEDEDEDEDVLGEPEDDEENEPSPSTSSALAAAVTVAVPGSAISNAPITTATATTIVVADSSDPKRQRIEQVEEKKPLDDSRRGLFQRLWTDEDEIGLLQGFLDYTTQRGSSHHNDTALFYDQIKSKLQLDFNKNQLVEKLRRLKKKYRNVLNKIDSGKEFSFKSPHDQATFEISRKIWSSTGQIGGAAEDNALDDDEINPNPNPNPNPNFSHAMPSKNEVMMGNSAEKKTPPSRKRSRSRPGMRTDVKRELNDDNNCISNNHNHNSNNSSHSIQGLIEETVKSCLSPIVKELLSSSNAMPMPIGGPFGFGARGFGGFTLNPLPLSLNLGSGEVVDDKWRKQQILELQVYSKRLELVQDQIKVALEELRSTGA